MKRPSITFYRRLSQGVFFLLLVYGGMLFKGEVVSRYLPRLSAPQGLPSTTRFQQGQILWAADNPPVFDAYPPAAVCRFTPQGGLFKACIVHMLSENLTWRTAFRYLLPHLLLFTLLAFLVGRWWCGWACPLGTVGDVLTWLRRRLGMSYVATSATLRQALRTTSYGVLASTLGISWLIGTPALAPYQCALFLPYCQTCPGRLLCPLFGGTIPGWRDFSSKIAGLFTVTSWVVLGLFAAAFFVGRRLWCHVCPIGLVTSWFNRGSGLTVRKTDASACNRCSSCADACPMGLTHVREELVRLSEKEKKVLNDPKCILCLRCVEQCPRDGCLEVRFFGAPVARSSFKPVPPMQPSPLPSPTGGGTG
jgi:ferredoxin